MATPVTISAFIMGMLFTVLRTLRLRRRMAAKPMAAKVPATVEMAVARKETRSVVYTLCMMSRLWNSFSYQSREKPFQTMELSPALKEKMMRRNMGA